MQAPNPAPKPMFYVIASGAQPGADVETRVKSFTTELRKALAEGYFPIPATFHYSTGGPTVMCGQNPAACAQMADIALIIKPTLRELGNAIVDFSMAQYNVLGYAFSHTEVCAIIIKASRIIQGGNIAQA